MTELTLGNIAEFLVECGEALGEMDVPDEGRYFLAPGWLFREIKLRPRVPKLRGARGRKRALDHRARLNW